MFVGQWKDSELTNKTGWLLVRLPVDISLSKGNIHASSTKPQLQKVMNQLYWSIEKVLLDDGINAIRHNDE